MSQLCFFIFKGTADVISNDSPFKRGNSNLQQFMHELLLGFPANEMIREKMQICLFVLCKLFSEILNFFSQKLMERNFRVFFRETMQNFRETIFFFRSKP